MEKHSDSTVIEFYVLRKKYAWYRKFGFIDLADILSFRLIPDNKNMYNVIFK